MAHCMLYWRAVWYIWPLSWASVVASTMLRDWSAWLRLYWAACPWAATSWAPRSDTTPAILAVPADCLASPLETCSPAAAVALAWPKDPAVLAARAEP